MALELNGTTGVSLVQDGVVTAADLASTLDLSSKTVTLPAANAPGLKLITSGTVSDVSSVTVDNCFTSTYLNYRLHFNFNLSDHALANLDFGMYLRAGGSSKTDSNYQYSMGYKNLGVNSAFNHESTTGAGFIKLIDNIDGGNTHAVGWVDVYAPATTDGSGKTFTLSELWTSDDGNNKIRWSQGVYTPDFAIDGFLLSTFNGGGLFDGSYQIYGYAL